MTEVAEYSSIFGNRSITIKDKDHTIRNILIIIFISLVILFCIDIRSAMKSELNRLKLQTQQCYHDYIENQCESPVQAIRDKCKELLQCSHRVIQDEIKLTEICGKLLGKSIQAIIDNTSNAGMITLLILLLVVITFAYKSTQRISKNDTWKGLVIGYYFITDDILSSWGRRLDGIEWKKYSCNVIEISWDHSVKIVEVSAFVDVSTGDVYAIALLFWLSRYHLFDLQGLNSHHLHQLLDLDILLFALFIYYQALMDHQVFEVLLRTSVPIRTQTFLSCLLLPFGKLSMSLIDFQLQLLILYPQNGFFFESQLQFGYQYVLNDGLRILFFRLLEIAILHLQEHLIYLSLQLTVLINLFLTCKQYPTHPISQQTATLLILIHLTPNSMQVIYLLLRQKRNRMLMMALMTTRIDILQQCPIGDERLLVVFHLNNKKKIMI